MNERDFARIIDLCFVTFNEVTMDLFVMMAETIGFDFEQATTTYLERVYCGRMV